MTNKTNVLIFITLPELGGAQSHVRDIAIKLNPDLFNVLIVTSATGWLTEQAELHQIPFRLLPALKRSIHPVGDAQALLQLMQVIRDFKPDVIHCHSTKAGVLGRLAGTLAGVRHIIFTAHGFIFHEALTGFKLKAAIGIEKIMTLFCHTIVPVSQFDKQRALKFKVAPDHRMTVIYNGIDTQQLPPAQARFNKRQELDIPSDAVVIGMVARFSKQKDQPLLLKTLATMIPVLTLYKVKVVLIGSGPELEHSKELAKQLGLLEVVYFLGDRTDVKEWLTAFDLFVLTSHYEGLPITILEAMATSLPVIASDVGGISEEVVDGQTGFVVPAGQIEPLKQKLELLITDSSKRQQMGVAARRYVRDTFELKLMIDLLRRLYLSKQVDKKNS
jgi:glycosyltransferase involved in cell wall biosynthesis